MTHARDRKVKYVCTCCGSDEVLCDAYAEWDVVEQQWSLQNTFGRGAWCNGCGCETRIREVKLTDAEYRAACE